MGTSFRSVAVFVLSLFLLGLFPPPKSASPQDPFLSGYVLWESGAPAMGVRIELVAEESTLADTYTDADGRYDFFEVENGSSRCDEPNRCTIQVLSEDSLLTSISLPALSSGAQVDTIVVSRPVD